MKKKCLSALLGVFTLNETFAQSGIFGNFANELKDEIETLFPIIVGIVFVVSFMFNLGKFFGEERDVKKGISNILIFVGITIAAGYIYKYVTSQGL